MNLDKLLRTLSNKNRRMILKTINDNPSTFTEIKNRLNLSSPSLARHITRLHAAELIEKNQTEQYLTSSLGILVLKSLVGLEFTAKHAKYIQEHDVSPIPDQLASSLWMLKETVQVSPTYRIIELLDQKTAGNIDFYYDLSDDFPEFMIDRVESKILEGTEFKAVYPENVLRAKIGNLPSLVMENIEFRVMDEVRLTVVVSDSFAFLGLPTGGYVDRNTYLYGEDKWFRDWYMKLFEYYWLKSRQYG